MFQTLLIQPLYNVFVYLIGVVPGGDVGLAIIALTLIIRFLFYPVFASQVRTTMGMQAAQPEMEELKEKYKDDKEEQVKRMGEIYKKYKINPLALFLSLFIQLPIFIALYYAFFHTALPAINAALLYPFVHAPAVVNVHFLGLFDLTKQHNIFMAAFVAALQFATVWLSMKRASASQAHLSEEKRAMLKMQQTVTTYTLPALMAAVTYGLPAAAGVYFATGSIVVIVQEWFIRRQLQNKASK